MTCIHSAILHGSAARLALGVVAALAVAAPAQAGFDVFEAAGADPASVTAARNAFRAAIGGGTVAGPNGSFGGLRREINWDAVPDARSDPTPLPGDFFNVNSPRGAIFATPGAGFLVSADSSNPTSTPILFGFPTQLQTFSPERLFTSVGSNITDVSFRLPGTATVATTRGFGVIFTGVENSGTRLELFDIDGNLIFNRAAPVSGDHGLSFIGAIANAGERIARVRLRSGENVILANGVLGHGHSDLVAMDDFLYGEPLVVPEPGSVALTLAGLSALMLWRRRARS